MPLTLRNLSKNNFKRKIKRKLFDILTSDDSYLDIRNIIQKVKFFENFIFAFFFRLIRVALIALFKI